MENKKPHAIFIPYPLQGHVIPSVNLAINLASQGFTITFINTHAVHQQTASAAENHDLFAKVRDSGLDIRYSTISDGLPVGYDRSLNHDEFMGALLHVFSAHVEEAVADIIASGEDVHCLIADTFFVWPFKIAKKFRLLYVSFWTEPALVFTLYYHLHLLRINRHFDSQDAERRHDEPIDYIPGVKAMEVKDTPSYLQELDTTSVCHQIIFKSFNEAKGADFVLCNSVQELENDTVTALQAEIPFYSIGPIFSTDFADCSVATSLWSESDCTHWLDNKPHASVLYVSFGSYAHLTKNDLTQIADGLSLSKVSFVWVLRPDIVSSNDKDPLPVGYKEEISDRAMIVPWCSQKKILTHPAIGGFLTHCGWNSTLESIWCQVPLLCFPLYTDQFTNRKLVVDDWKIGISLSTNKMITKEQVSDNINCLMRGDSKDDFRNRIKEAKKIMETALSPTGSSHTNMSQFIQDVKTKIQKLIQ
ncbi:UDP-glycosyltransferase 86A2-like [Euphorbia lathyris]|uniref:UDP-glycosyltransferase 86A2-like n=1 Tax=Euphorbia lathyris TaxID=212925 RepID=UPI00331343FB